MKVPKGKSFTVGQRTFEEGEILPDSVIGLLPKSWTEGKTKTSGKADKTEKVDKPKK